MLIIKEKLRTEKKGQSNYNRRIIIEEIESKRDKIRGNKNNDKNRRKLEVISSVESIKWF